MDTHPDFDIGFAELRQALEAIPAVESLDIHYDPQLGRSRPDAAITVYTSSGKRHLLIEVKSSGEPRFIREASFRLRDSAKMQTEPTYGVVMAPFISEEGREILRREQQGWFDLAGNCLLSFDSLHFEVARTDTNPFAEKRRLKSPFSPKTARVLRVMLSEPGPWKGVELASRAKVSVGQVSKVRELLLDHEWAMADAEGLRIVRPAALLEAWRSARRQPQKLLLNGYTLQQGKALDTHLQILFERAQRTSYATVLLAAHSVARRIAPYARVAGEYFYADAKGLEMIQEQLRPEAVDHGANVMVFAVEDELMVLDSIPLEPEPLRGTSLIQTYLDLSALGERGKEAADFLFKEKLKPQLKRASE